MTRLLIIDDSPLMRRLLTEIFINAGDFEVEVARTGTEALMKLAEFAPDVVTLDIHMPGMDGLACLDQIMIQHPCPVVMVSSATAAGADETLEAMALGAVDFIEKPKGAVSLEIDALTQELVDKTRNAAKARISPTIRLRDRVKARSAAAGRVRIGLSPSKFDPARSPARSARSGLVVVGCSTGGPPALDAVIGGLPGNFPWPIVIAQHMPATFTGPLARRLDKVCRLTVSEVSGTSLLLPGHAYVGRGDGDILISRRRDRPVAIAAPSSGEHIWHPSVDRLVESAMNVFASESLIGVLMTGMGNDGAAAMKELQSQGGYTLAEAAETAVVWGMPGALVGLGGATEVRPLDQISDALSALVGL